MEYRRLGLNGLYLDIEFRLKLLPIDSDGFLDKFLPIDRYRDGLLAEPNRVIGFVKLFFLPIDRYRDGLPDRLLIDGYRDRLLLVDRFLEPLGNIGYVIGLADFRDNDLRLENLLISECDDNLYDGLRENAISNNLGKINSCIR